MRNFLPADHDPYYASCIKTVVHALTHGLGSWQRGYTNKGIPFPRGASCTYTLPPSKNLPVPLTSGTSSGDRIMDERELYSYMIYRAPRNEKEYEILFRACSTAIPKAFEKWKKSCFITDIVASGGIAPQPAPMGTGPGPVTGAKGRNGKIRGAYFDGDFLYSEIVKAFSAEND